MPAFNFDLPSVASALSSPRSPSLARLCAGLDVGLHCASTTQLTHHVTRHHTTFFKHENSEEVQVFALGTVHGIRQEVSDLVRLYHNQRSNLTVSRYLLKKVSRQSLSNGQTNFTRKIFDMPAWFNNKIAFWKMWQLYFATR
jgi:endonuclease III-like uncharacterized protein